VWGDSGVSRFLPDYLIRVETHPEEYTLEKFFEKIAHFGTLTLINDLPIEYSASQQYEMDNPAQTLPLIPMKGCQ